MTIARAMTTAGAMTIAGETGTAPSATGIGTATATAIGTATFALTAETFAMRTTYGEIFLKRQDQKCGASVSEWMWIRSVIS